MSMSKLTYRTLILLAFVTVNGFILFGISQVLAYLNTGADTNKLLHIGTALKTDYTPEVEWVDTINPGRPLETYAKQKITRDYLDAWYVRQQAFNGGDRSGIEDHYTVNSRQKLYSLLDQNSQNNIRIESTTLSHTLSLEFYSADGTLAVLTDNHLRRYQRVFKNDFLQYQGEEQASYRIILLLENGVWRIRHLQKLTSETPEIPIDKPFVPATTIAGINYYPQQTPWDTFGQSYNGVQIQKDFALIKELKLNTIRVFIGYEDFGKGEVSSEKMERLIDLLDRAAAADLQVIVTLFDFYGDYSVVDWTANQRHVLTIANTIKAHPALYAWDIKNEPDLDFKNRTSALVTAWLEQMLHILKATDPQHPITIGWSTAENALLMEDQVDYISFHYYKDLKDLNTTYKTLKEGTHKTIILEEFGRSANRGFWNPIGYSRNQQANYYKDFFNIKDSDLHFLSWTLYDFKNIPDQVTGRWPWRKQKQKHFGIINADEKKTSAFEVIKHQEF